MTCRLSAHTQRWLASIPDSSSDGHTQLQGGDPWGWALSSVLWSELCNLNAPSFRLCGGKIIFLQDCRESPHLSSPSWHTSPQATPLAWFTLLTAFTWSLWDLVSSHTVMKQKHFSQRCIAFLLFTVIQRHWQHLVLLLLEAALDSVSAKMTNVL